MDKIERAARKALLDLEFYQKRCCKTRGGEDGFFIDTIEDLKEALNTKESIDGKPELLQSAKEA